MHVQRLRKDFELPSVSVLQRLTSTIKNKEDTQFLSDIFSNLKYEKQQLCALPIDEVYVKSVVQYRGGSVLERLLTSRMKEPILSCALW